MNKNELISAIADDTGKSKSDVATILSSLSRAAGGALAASDEFPLPGIGKFKTAVREARKGRHPSTGAVIDVPAKTIVRFKVGKELADAVA